MGELTNALQGKLNSRKGHVKDPGKSQLDLFTSLSDREITAPKIIMSKPEVPASERPDPEMVLPPLSAPPADVSADVRAVLSDSGPARPVETSVPGDHPPLRTGVYHRPQRPAPPPRPPAPRMPAEERPTMPARIRDWFSGVELDRRMISLVAVLAVLAALVGFWSACPRGGSETTNASPAEEAPATSDAGSQAPAPAPTAAVSPEPAAPASAPLLAATDWAIPGTEAFRGADGAILIRFSDPVFVSGDKISVEGMRALKAVAAKLSALKTGARVVVTGYTDDVPLSKPTPQFRDNADIAAARAKAAAEHLSQFARANKGLAFEAQIGDPARAPFPNDTPQNRRMNRTATVHVISAP